MIQMLSAMLFTLRLNVIATGGGRKISVYECCNALHLRRNVGLSQSSWRVTGDSFV
jgi:hypothetical protein